MGYTRPGSVLRNRRLWSALGAYTVLALIAYAWLDDPFRTVVWIFCGGLAVLTLAHAKYGERR